MKYFTIALVLASVSAIKLADVEDEWIVVPPQDIKMDDKDWGHEIQRLGHVDWLDGHVKEVATIQAGINQPKKARDSKEYQEVLLIGLLNDGTAMVVSWLEEKAGEDGMELSAKESSEFSFKFE